MNRDVLLGAGVVLAFIVLVNRAKKNQVTDTDTQGGGGGGGIGGGPFIGGVPAGPLTVNNIVQPAARPANQGQVITAVGIKDTTPTAAVTSSAQAKAIETATNTGGIIPIGQGGSSTPTYSTGTVTQADLKSGVAGNTVFKPFNGSFVDAKFLGFVGSTPKFEFN